MDLLLHQILAGLATGGIYASVALALVMIYQATHLVNFAQGEMAMFATYLAWALIQAGVPYWGAFAITVVSAFVLGVAIERVIIRPVENAPMLVGRHRLHRPAGDLQQRRRLDLHATRSSRSRARSRPQPLFGNSYVVLARARLDRRSRWSCCCCCSSFFRFTPLGLAMRAAAQNPVSSRLVGIRVGWMLALGWGLAAAIGAIAGMMVAPTVFLEPNMMGGILLYAFAGALLGGIDSPGGAVLGGFIVGVLENVVGAYVGTELKLTVALVLIVGVLVVRPSGLFGRVHVVAGVTMIAPRTSSRRDRLASPSRLACSRWRCALPFFLGNYRVFQLTLVAGLRDRAARPEHADRLQRPDLARPRRLLRDRRLHRGDPDGQARHAVLGDDPDRRRRLPRRRLPVRPAGAAARRPLPRAGHLRARRRDAADPQAQGPRALDRRRRRASSSSSPRRRSGPACRRTSGSTSSPWPGSWCCFVVGWNLLRGRIGRAMVAIRDQPIAAQAMGVNTAL